MRLWHKDLIPKLPRPQLLGQHRECCALRGLGWAKRHSTVDYVFNYTFECLVAYHNLVMLEMINRGYRPSVLWFNCQYRGQSIGSDPMVESREVELILYSAVKEGGRIFQEHDTAYLRECVDNMTAKGVVCKALHDLVERGVQT